MTIQVTSTAKRQVIDLTEKIQSAFPNASGVVMAFVKHSTVAITACNLDPGTDEDLLDALDSLIPEHQWRHPHNPEHAPDHLLASILGPSMAIPITKGRLDLGTWQNIVLVDFDGPHERSVELVLLPGTE